MILSATRQRVAARLRVYDDLAFQCLPTTGEARLAADAALACFQGKVVPPVVRTRMLDTLERLGS